MNNFLFSKMVLRIRVILSGNKLYAHTKKAIKTTRTLSFDQYYVIFCDTNDIKLKSIEKMIDSASTYHQWKKIYDCVPCDEGHKKLALSKMLELAKGVDQFLEIYNINSDNCYGTASFKKIEKMLVTYDNWSHFYDKARLNPGMKMLILHKMLKLASSFKEAKWVCVKTESGSPLELMAIQFMMGYAVTYNEWETIFEKTVHYDKLHIKAFEKMQQISNDLRIDNEIVDQFVDKNIFTDLNHKNAVEDYNNYSQ